MMTMSAFFVASGFGNEWPSRIWRQTAKCSPSTSGVAAAPPGSSRSALSIGQPEAMEPATTYLMKLRRDWDMRIVLLGAFEKLLRFLTGDAIQKTIRERQAAAAGFHAEEVWLHGGVAPGEKFHADLGAGFEDFALRRAHKMLAFAVGFEE